MVEQGTFCLSISNSVSWVPLFRQFQRFAACPVGTRAVSRQARQPGRGRRSRPTGKMIRRRKLLEIAPESPASGARFVRRVLHQEPLNIFDI